MGRIALAFALVGLCASPGNAFVTLRRTTPDDAAVRWSAAHHAAIDGAGLHDGIQVAIEPEFAEKLARAVTGATDPADVADISAAPFEMQFRGVGQFPPQRNKPARVLWVGIVPNPPLEALSKQVKAAVVKAGLAPEDRAFSPHMTLSRLDPPKDAREFLERYPAFVSRVMPVHEFILFSSDLSPQGATHRREAVYPLKVAD